jgi:hypothetical protein
MSGPTALPTAYAIMTMALVEIPGAQLHQTLRIQRFKRTFGMASSDRRDPGEKNDKRSNEKYLRERLVLEDRDRSVSPT